MYIIDVKVVQSEVSIRVRSLKNRFRSFQVVFNEKVPKYGIHEKVS